MEVMDDDITMNNNNNIIQEECLENKDNLYKIDCDININKNNKQKKENSKNKAKKIAPNSDQYNQDRNEDFKNSFEDEENSKTRFPLAKIKNIMKLDENVKLVQKEVYNLLGKATEIFLHELAQNSHKITALNKRKTMNIEDIATALKRNDRYTFINLKSIVDENVMEEVTRKEEKIEQKSGLIKEQSTEKIKNSTEKKIKTSSKVNSLPTLADKNRKIDSFFHKN